MNGDLAGQRRKLVALLRTRTVEGREELVTGSISDKLHHKDQNRGADGSTKQNSESKESRFDKKDIAIELFALAGGIGFFTQVSDFMEFLGVYGSKPWCILGGLISVEFALAHVLVKHLIENSGFIKWLFSILVAGQTVAVCCVVLFGQKEKSQNFSLKLATAADPYDQIQLTNDFLKATYPIRSDNFRGLVVVPAKDFAKLPALRFTAVNDSDVSSDTIQYNVSIRRNFDFRYEPGWYEVIKGPEDDKLWRTIGHDVKALPPLQGWGLPAIQFKPCAAISNAEMCAVAIQIIPNDRKDSFWGFWLFIPVATNMTKFQVVHGNTNGSFTVPFDVPPVSN